ncbi:MAG: hypothetical protein ACFFB2_18220 [Promethearchaeota archaeon]
MVLVSLSFTLVLFDVIPPKELSGNYKIEQNAPEIKWYKTFGGRDVDQASALIQTIDGGYAIGGYTRSYSAGDMDFWLIKTDTNGNEEWNQTYGGTEDEIIEALLQTYDGGFVLAGYTESFGAGQDDFLLIKTDKNGQTEWYKTYGGTSIERAQALISTDDGGFILAGSTYSFGAGHSDFWLVKTDKKGIIEWNKTYGGTGYEVAYDLLHTINGGFAITGTTTSFDYETNNADFWLVKTDAKGNIMWNKTYGGLEPESANALSQTNGGGFLLAGYTGSASLSNGCSDFWLVKTDDKGATIWNKSYGGWNCDYCYDLIQTPNGGSIITGVTQSSGLGFSDLWLIKTTRKGVTLWNETYGGWNDDCGNAIIRTTDGGFAIAGDTDSYGVGDLDFWLVKYPPIIEPSFTSVSLDTSEPPTSLEIPGFHISSLDALSLIPVLISLSTMIIIFKKRKI